MKTLKYVLAGVFVIELLLAAYKVPVADTTVLVAAAGITGGLGLLGWIFSMLFKATAQQSAALREMYLAAQYDRQGERDAWQATTREALYTAQVSSQAAALIAERVAQGVRLWKEGSRYVLEIPGQPRLLDARRDAGMDQAMIDLMAAEQAPYLLEEGGD